jgi:hypothetical protein
METLEMAPLLNKIEKCLTSLLNLTERFQLDIVIGIETRLNLTERFQPDIVIGIETWLNLTERLLEPLS